MYSGKYEKNKHGNNEFKFEIYIIIVALSFKRKNSCHSKLVDKYL